MFLLERHCWWALVPTVPPGHHFHHMGGVTPGLSSLPPSFLQASQTLGGQQFRIQGQPLCQKPNKNTFQQETKNPIPHKLVE